MFRFTIRDLLWLTVVIGLVAALLMEKRETATAVNRANNLQSMFEALAQLAAWNEDWRIKTTESSMEIYRPRLASGAFCKWEASTGKWPRLRTDSLVREFSRDAIRARKEAAGFPTGPLPEEVGRDER
jgi:hypothetical protein